MKIYVAGPYSSGDVVLNVARAIKAGDEIASMGHVPFIPHLSHFWHLLCPHDYGFWMSQDYVWVLACHALVRLEGESSGADSEVALAIENNIPVFYGMDDFKRNSFYATYVPG